MHDAGDISEECLVLIFIEPVFYFFFFISFFFFFFWQKVMNGAGMSACAFLSFFAFNVRASVCASIRTSIFSLSLSHGIYA